VKSFISILKIVRSLGLNMEDLMTRELLNDRQITSAHIGGVVWNELHSEREQVCEAYLRNVQSKDQKTIDVCELGFSMTISDRRARDLQLQARLRLIDDALDRLMSGSYGDCVICGRWIQDTKLHADPAFPFCVECERQKRQGTTVREYVPTFQSMNVM
jgi:RNA polymerase-binding transcription factor DksA